MNRSYNKTLFVAEVNRFFPFIKHISNALLRKIFQIAFGLFVSPVFLYKVFFAFYIPYAELVLTTKCSLNCKDCANLMPFYKKPCDVPLENLFSAIDNLLSTADGLYLLTLIGGEPFMYKEIDVLINRLVKNKKIYNIRIVTNGTIIPSEKILKSLENKKLSVSVSQYPGVNYERFIEKMKSRSIKYDVERLGAWLDYGSLNKRSFNALTLSKSFCACASAECKTILGGKLFTCPRSSHGADVGYIPPMDGDFVDLINTPRGELKNRIKSLYNKPYVAACNYCTPPWERKEIDVAVQSERM